MGKKHSLVRIAKPLIDMEGKWSSLLHILIPSLTSHSFLPLTPCAVSVVSASLSQLLSSAPQTDTQSCCSDAGLWTCVECLTADIRMPVASCVSLFFHSEGRGFQWSEESRAEQQQDRGAISPTASLDTDFRLHASPWNIITRHSTQLEGHTQPSRYCIWFSLPTWLDWVATEHIGFYLAEEQETERGQGMRERRKQGSKFIWILLKVCYLQCMLPNLGRDTSSDSKGLTLASLLVQSLSRDVRKEARNAGTKRGWRGDSGQNRVTISQ